MTIEGLRQFILSQGPSKNVVNLDWTIIWAINKKVIDPISPRHTAVLEDRKVTCRILGVSKAAHSEDKPKHAKNPSLGNKKVYYGPTILIDQADAASFTQGEEITLMNWGNAFVTSITSSDSTTSHISSIDLTLHLTGDFKKTQKKITWLEPATQSLVPVDLVDFDYLITKDKLEEEDDVKDFVNPKTEWRFAAWADEGVWDVKVGDVVQFERKGYFRLDKAADKQGGKAVFFAIPTGKEAK